MWNHFLSQAKYHLEKMLAYFFIQNCFKCDHDHNLVLSVIMTIAKFSE